MDDRTLSDADFDVCDALNGSWVITFAGRSIAFAPNIAVAVARLHLARVTRADLLARFFAKDA